MKMIVTARSSLCDVTIFTVLKLSTAASAETGEDVYSHSRDRGQGVHGLWEDIAAGQTAGSSQGAGGITETVGIGRGRSETTEGARGQSESRRQNDLVHPTNPQSGQW